VFRHHRLDPADAGLAGARAPDVLSTYAAYRDLFEQRDGPQGLT